MPSRAISAFDALVTTVTGLTTTADRVRKSRVYLLPDSQSNALSIRAGGETVVEWNSATVHKSREFTISIHVAAKEAEIDDIVLKIESEIWAAIQADVTLGQNFIMDTEFVSSNEIEHEPGAKTTALVEQTWAVQYVHSITSMET